MKLFPFVALFLLVTVVAADSGRDYEVTLTLTDDQADAVRLSRAEETEIEFTKEQIDIILDILPLFDYEVITLMPEHLSRSNVVIIVFHVPDDYLDPRSIISMDPQPSP
ncbi:MAG: hypothetical protein KAW14_07225 [Candidatus Aegiribacteria sp.]|nr:hypothetical protein [Candidatus Aegiribacteria sp.]